MIILGIDPGIAIVGYGIIEYKNNKFKVIDYGAITTPSTMNDIKRLEKIYKGIYILIKNYNIDEVAVEELFFNKKRGRLYAYPTIFMFKTLLSVNHQSINSF